MAQANWAFRQVFGDRDSTEEPADGTCAPPKYGKQTDDLRANLSCCLPQQLECLTASLFAALRLFASA